MKALVDTGNNVSEEVAISEALHRKLQVGYQNQEKKLIGTAGADARITKLGKSNPIKMKFEGIRKEFVITPTVIKELADTVNIGDRFLSNLSQKENMKVRIEYASGEKKLTLGTEASKSNNIEFT